MGWFSRLFGPEELASVPGVVQQAGPVVMAYTVIDLLGNDLPEFMREGFANKSGRTVGERAAMSNATFNRAVTLNTSVIGMLPLNLHRVLSDGTKEKAEDHPVHRLLRKQPNGSQTPFEFKSYMQGRALLHGDAYAFKVPGVRGPQALWPLDPRRVTPIQSADDFSLKFKYQPKQGGFKMFAAEEIFHLRAPWSSDGLTGDGLLKLAAQVLGLADITEEAAAAFLQNAANPGGVLMHPKTLSADAIERLRGQWRDEFMGPKNQGRWIVTEEGIEAKTLANSSRDAEAVAQRKYQSEEIARMTGVPRPLLMFDETSWGSGIEQLGLYLVTYCLMPWFVAWEEAIARSLLSERDRENHYAKFNEAALLRGSLKDQAEFLAKALGGPGAAGFMVPNEARDKMDMNPIPGGDVPAWMQGVNDANPV